MGQAQSRLLHALLQFVVHRPPSTNDLGVNFILGGYFMLRVFALTVFPHIRGRFVISFYRNQPRDFRSGMQKGREQVKLKGSC